MAHIDDLIAEDINLYLKKHEEKEILRFITCGSVDDGKSTLIGRMLYESHMLFDDHLAALEQDSKNIGTQEKGIDFALLVDGLSAEREQGITIDVAYRFFSTDRRKYIVADTPGHEEYTRNMATGSSTADVAIILVDARNGIMTQTRRHSFIVSMLGVKKIILAINKLDLVNYSKEIYDKIVQDYTIFAENALEIEEITSIPISALLGDNIISKSDNTKWYNGPTIMDYLETVEIIGDNNSNPFRMPVQWVNRPNLDFRGYCGMIASGKIKPGDEIRVLPGGQQSTIKSIFFNNNELKIATSGKSVTITLSDEIDVSRGNVIVSAKNPGGESNQFQAHILWLSNDAMIPGRQYIFKSNTQTSLLNLGRLKYQINVNTLNQTPAKELG